MTNVAIKAPINKSGPAREIDCAMREMTTGAFEKALGVLRKHRGQLEQGGKLLLEKEALTREELPMFEAHRPAVAAAFKVEV